MNSLLNKGLNFCILPLKLDLTEVLVDFKKFERSMMWKEFFFGREVEEAPKEKIFKSNKTNFPRGHAPPEGLKTFINSVKSEIIDPRNRNSEKCNLPVSEIQALKELISLQRERQIVIKACDKGSGIILLDFDKYLKVCYEHLLSVQEGTQGQYYKEVPSIEIEVSKKEIRAILDEGLEAKIITKEEYNFMDPTDKDVAKFYCNFKVHKEHKVGEAPPVRPIISGSNSMTEGIAQFVEHHVGKLATLHETYIQDTPDFLRAIEKVQGLGDDVILASIDVRALFTNIPQKEGIKSMESALEERKNKETPTEFILELMKLILNNNLFSFHDGTFKQKIGSAMGSKSAPSYANHFMARQIDPIIKALATNAAGESQLLLLKRFLDDLFLIFKGTSKELHAFFDQINKINPCIQFTMVHTEGVSENESDKCPCKPLKEIPFLDTLRSIKNKKIEVDLFRKDTDKNQYLLLNSCHPASVTKNIPFSLSLRIVRICTDYNKRKERLVELKSLLKARGYSDRSIDSAIERALKIPRDPALKWVNKERENKRPVMAVTYDPRLPSIPPIMAKHWRSMIVQDQYLKDVFEEPPLTAFKRQRNIRDHIIRAKVVPKPKERNFRKKQGMKKCGKECTACPFIKEGKKVKIDGKETWDLRKEFNCETSNVIYLIECSKERCTDRYIGETGRPLKHRLADHRGYVNQERVNYVTGAHFNQPGHTLSDLKITILERSKKTDSSYRKERERYFINKFNTLHKGMNRQN